jgi:glycosyltransferase involved in cell wall biosynthesis
VRVAVIFYGLPPEGGGGFTFQQTLLRTLREVAPSSRHDFVFYAAGGTGGERGLIEIPSTRPVRWRLTALRGLREVQDRMNAPRTSVPTWFEKSLAEQRIDLVWFASHWLEDTEIPYVCTIWDLAHLEQPWFPELSADGEWERRQHYFQRYLPKATRIIVPNEALTDLLLGWFPIGRQRVIEDPFPTPDFTLDAGQGDPGVLERHGLERGRYLFYPAQFWPHKNHYAAFQALSRLPGYELALSGSDKGWLDHVKRLAGELGVADRVKYLGFVSQDELVALYRNAHCLLYLSWFGPENLPPLEALALGCPVVCADVPGMSIQLGDAALFAPPTDFDVIADRVRQLEEDSVRALLQQEGLRLAESRTAERYVEPVLAFLDEFEPVQRTWGPSV